MRRDNRGFSLVELVIAIAISGIVMGAAIMFLSGSQKSYRKAEETIDLQKEAQILMEQLGNWVMECNCIVEADATTTTPAIALYSIPRNYGKAGVLPDTYSENTYASKRVIWLWENKLYMIQISGINNLAGDAIGTGMNFSTDATEQNCVGEFVHNFTVNRAEGMPQKIEISLILEEGTEKYGLTNEFLIRNEYIPKGE